MITKVPVALYKSVTIDEVNAFPVRNRISLECFSMSLKIACRFCAAKAAQKVSPKVR
jgi:hypothetical protein